MTRWMKMKMMDEFDDDENENEDEGEYEWIYYGNMTWGDENEDEW